MITIAAAAAAQQTDISWQDVIVIFGCFGFVLAFLWLLLKD